MNKELRKEIEAHIGEQREFYKDMFFKLLRFETVNPPGGEEAIADFIANVLKGENSDCSLQYVAPERPNVLAELSFGKPGKKLVFNAHIDVVPPGNLENWNTQPFEPVEIDGNIYGRGSSDDKGGLMAMIIAYRTLQEIQPDICGKLLLCGVMGEETGGMGTKYWVEHGGKADAAIVGEPSKMELVIAHRGAYRPIFSFQGRTSHSSEPDLGENAIYSAANFVCKVAQLNEAFKESGHPLTGSPTIAATVFQGGVKNNVIPDYAEVSIDRRLSPGETYEDAERQLLDVLKQMQENGEIGKWELSRYLNNKGAAACDQYDPLVLELQEILKEHSYKSEVCGMRATTDMYLLQDAGISTVIFGPGDMGVAHCPNESIPFQEILDAAKIYAELAIRYLK